MRCIYYIRIRLVLVEGVIRMKNNENITQQSCHNGPNCYSTRSVALIMPETLEFPWVCGILKI